MAERLVKTKENPKLTERQPWTPKGIWGHKDPAEMTLEEKEQMLEKARYSGPLATAYWENEIADHKFKPARQEAEALRKRVAELEDTVKVLNEKLAAKPEVTSQQEETDANNEVDRELAR